MKSKLIIFLLPIFIMGCEPNPTKSEFYDSSILYPKIVVIDSCEYIQYHGYNAKHIIHKGNCKNSFHKYNGGSNE
jgi:hypothetical protein